MAEYYGKSYSSIARNRRRSALGLLLDVIMGVVSLCVVVLFVATLFVPVLDPREWGEVSTLGLIAPFIYSAQAFVTLYWIMRWRVGAAIFMVLVSLFGLFQLPLFYKVETRRIYSEPNLRPRYDSRALKIMTYNVRSFIDDEGGRCIDSLVAMLKIVNPDILCLQEMGFNDMADSMLAPLNPMPKSLSRTNLSPAIYSRYPIIRAGRVDSLKNFVWADVVVKQSGREDTLRVFNTHLHSTAIRRDDSDYIEHHEYLEDDSLQQMRSMVSRLTENNRLRASQVDTLAQMVAASPYPTIVCGDFNDTPISYTYRTIARKMQDAFTEAGRGYSHTYRGFHDMLRIDYVLCSNEFEPLSYEVIDSWTLEQVARRQRGVRDTVWRRTYGHSQEIPSFERIVEADEAYEGDSTSYSIDNKVHYSDHYPVFVRLLYNGKTN